METQVHRVHPLELARRKAGLSREALAALAGVAVRTIYGIEREDRNAQGSTLDVLARALNTTPDHLKEVA